MVPPRKGRANTEAAAWKDTQRGNGTRLERPQSDAEVYWLIKAETVLLVTSPARFCVGEHQDAWGLGQGLVTQRMKKAVNA